MNFETTDKKLLQIVLAGQTELAAVLNRVDLRQLKQRIEIRLEVKPLSPADVRLYMLHRWERAGGATDLPFTIGAVSIIAAASRGIPRLVNRDLRQRVANGLRRSAAGDYRRARAAGSSRPGYTRHPARVE